MRCPQCGIAIFEKACKSCPPVFTVMCPRCGTFMEMQNESMTQEEVNSYLSFREKLLNGLKVKI